LAGRAGIVWSLPWHFNIRFWLKGINSYVPTKIPENNIFES